MLQRLRATEDSRKSQLQRLTDNRMHIQRIKYDLCNICPLWLGTECGYYCKYHAEETIRFCAFVIDRVVVIYYL